MYICTHHGELLVPAGVLEHGKHHLADIEGVVPVVVLDGRVPVVLLHGHRPAAERRVVNLEVRQETQVSEHANRCLGTKHTTQWMSINHSFQ